MRTIRWLVALPAALIAAIAAHFLVSFALSIGHGFDTIASFWRASDMNGMPVSGTYIVLVTRAVSAAALVGVIAYLVPKYNRTIGLASAFVVGVAAIVLFIYLVWSLVSSGADVGVGVWYRTSLEVLGIVGGALAGAAVGASAAGDEGPPNKSLERAREE